MSAIDQPPRDHATGSDERIRPDVGRPPAAHKGTWMLLLVLGVLTVAAGVAVLLWPGATLVVVALLFGAWLVVAGMVRIGIAFTDRSRSTGLRTVVGVLGVLLVFAGVGLLANLVASLATLVLFIGFALLVDGFGDIVAGATGERGSRAWPVTTGILGVAAGLVVLSRPGIALVTLVAVLSALLIVVGIARISAAFTLRGLARA